MPQCGITKQLLCIRFVVNGSVIHNSRLYNCPAAADGKFWQCGNPVPPLCIPILDFPLARKRNRRHKGTKFTCMSEFNFEYVRNMQLAACWICGRTCYRNEWRADINIETRQRRWRHTVVNNREKAYKFLQIIFFLFLKLTMEWLKET